MKWLLAFAVMLPATASWARAPEDVFKKQIIITSKRVPMRFSSASAMTSFLRKNRTKTLNPQKDQKSWKFEFVGCFAKPLNDLQVMVKFYDITEGNSRYVTAHEHFTTRGERILISSLVLEKPQFAPNRKYKMVITNRGKQLASTTFTLKGKGKTYSGKVEFSDQEVK